MMVRGSKISKGNMTLIIVGLLSFAVGLGVIGIILLPIAFFSVRSQNKKSRGAASK